jgi:hypothetical protein
MNCAQELGTGIDTGYFNKNAYCNHHIGAWRMSREDETDYETMQPEFKPVVVVSVSMGVEGEDSGSGAVEAMTKSEVKKSIVV